jgi:hypothetical protein
MCGALVLSYATPLPTMEPAALRLGVPHDISEPLNLTHSRAVDAGREKIPTALPIDLDRIGRLGLRFLDWCGS